MWTDELFHVKKPIIALLHLRALPGDPLYEKDATMGEVMQPESFRRSRREE